MIYISHRGNLTGKGGDSWENHPDYIKYALKQNFDVEIDVWWQNGTFFLGHDIPKYKIDLTFLQNEKLWCHAKNSDALRELSKLQNIHYFWHESDAYTLTSKGFIWSYPTSRLNEKTICLMPETQPQNNLIYNCFGICSDYIQRYKNTMSDN